MPVMKCVGCGATEQSTRPFYLCKKCGAQFCSHCGSKGNKCPKNCGGHLG